MVVTLSMIGIQWPKQMKSSIEFSLFISVCFDSIAVLIQQYSEHLLVRGVCPSPISSIFFEASVPSKLHLFLRGLGPMFQYLSCRFPSLVSLSSSCFPSFRAVVVVTTSVMPQCSLLPFLSTDRVLEPNGYFYNF